MKYMGEKTKCCKSYNKLYIFSTSLFKAGERYERYCYVGGMYKEEMHMSICLEGVPDILTSELWGLLMIDLKHWKCC